MDNERLVEEISSHIIAISSLLGIPVTESNEGTPKRVAKMYCNELFRNRNDDFLDELNDSMKLFPNEGTTTPVILEGIEFHSVCEHHWLPFSGTVKVSYVPNNHIVGLSKIPRVVKYFSKRPQLQERLTKEIGEYLVDWLQPLSLTVEVKATHSCVMCRGAESNCVTTTTFEY